MIAEPAATSDAESARVQEVCSGNRVASNTMIYLVSQLLGWASSLITVSLIPRTLGETAIGQLAIAHTYVGNIALILTLSIEQYLAAEAGRDRHRTEQLLRATLGLRLVCIPVMIAAAVSALYVIRASHIVWILGAQVMLGASIGYLLGPMRWVLAGWEDAKRVARNDLLLTALPLCSLPFLRSGAVVFSFATLILGQPASISTALAVNKQINLRPIFDLALWKTIIRGSLGFLVNDMIVPLYAITTVSILNHFTDTAAVGVYSQSQRLLGTFMFVPTAFGTALLPGLTRLAEADRSEFQRMQQRVVVAMIVMGLPITLLAFMLAVPFCHLLYGSTQFRALPLTVQASGLCVIPLYITMMLYRFLVAERKNGIWCCFMAGTLIVQTAMCFLLVPMTLHGGWHNGSVGAVIATAIAEVTTAVCALALLKANPFTTETVGRIARAMVALLAMAAAMWLTRSLFFVFTALLGLLVFGFVAWKLQALGTEDQAKLGALVRSKFAALLGRRRSA